MSTSTWAPQQHTCFLANHREWSAFLGFNRQVPQDQWPDEHGPYYLASQVLPMGFKKSVSLAQHVHRAMVRRASESQGNVLQSEKRSEKIERSQTCIASTWTISTCWREWTAELIAIPVLALTTEASPPGRRTFRVPSPSDLNQTCRK